MKKEDIALGIFLAFILGAGIHFYSLQTLPQNVAETQSPVVPREPPKSSPKKTNVPTVATTTEDRWLKYTNQKFGFEFEYPSFLKIYSTAENDKKELKFIDKDHPFGFGLVPASVGDEAIGPDFSIRKIESDTIDDWYVLWKKDFETARYGYEGDDSAVIKGEVESVKDVYVQGVKGKEIITKSYFPLYTFVFVLEKNGYLYGFYGSFTHRRAGEREKLIKTFKEVAATFKFI